MRTSPDTPTDRESGRILLLGTFLSFIIAAYVLPPDGRFGLGVGVILGGVAMYALWMSDGAGRDTSQRDGGP